MLFNLFVCFKGLQGSLLDTLKFNYYSEYYKLHVQLEETQKKHCIQGTDPNKQELSQHCKVSFVHEKGQVQGRCHLGNIIACINYHVYATALPATAN